MEDVYLVSAVRSAVGKGKQGGGLAAHDDVDDAHSAGSIAE